MTGEIEPVLIRLAILVCDVVRTVKGKRGGSPSVRLDNWRVGYPVHRGDQNKDTKQASQKPLQFKDRFEHLAL